MDDEKYAISTEDIKTLENLITEYKENDVLDEGSKKYLEGISYDYKQTSVQGLDLNYLFYNTKFLKDIIFELNDKTKANITEIGLINGDNITTEPNYTDEKHNVDNIKPINNNETNFITIAKGQYCDYESYSAFNYHIKIEKEEESVIYKTLKRYDSTLNKLVNLPAKKNIVLDCSNIY